MDSMQLPAEQGAALRDCLERIERSESLESALSRHPEHEHALRPLMETALALRTLEARPAPPDLASRIDLALDAEEQQRQVEARPVTARQATNEASVSKTGWRAWIPSLSSHGKSATRQAAARPMILRLAGAALAVLLLIYGGAYASADSLPGDRLYDLKVGIERVRLRIAAPGAATNMAERFAERRILEAAALEAEGRDGEAALAGIERLAPWLGDDRARQLLEGQRELDASSPVAIGGDNASKPGLTTSGDHDNSDQTQATAVARLGSSSLRQTPTSRAGNAALSASSPPTAAPATQGAGVAVTPVAEPGELIAPPSVVRPVQPEPEPEPEEPAEPQPREPGPEPEPEEPTPGDPVGPNPGQPAPTATSTVQPSPSTPTPTEAPPVTLAVVEGLVLGEGSMGTPARPLEGATVEFYALANASGAPTPPPIRVQTDRAGWFRANLRPGAYQVFIDSDGYLRQEYGARNTGSGPTPGTPIHPVPGPPLQLEEVTLQRDPNSTRPAPGNDPDPSATWPPALQPGRPTPTALIASPTPIPSAIALPSATPSP